MKCGNLVMASLVGALFLVGCQSEEATQAPAAAPTAEAMKIMDDALVAGRVGALPMDLTVRSVAVSNAAAQRFETEKGLTKAIQAPTRHAVDPVEAAEHIIAMHQQTPISEGLSLTLSLPREDFVVGEAIVVRAVLENTSDRVKAVATRLDPQFLFDKFIITNPSGQKVGYSPVTVACSRGDLLVEKLNPGEKRVEDISLFFSKDGWLFSDVGEYRIQALFGGLTEDDGRLDSNVLSLVVNPGTTEDQKAAELLMGHDQGLFMLWGEGDHLVDGIDTLRTVVARYPSSAAATYARIALGSNMATDFFDGRFNRVRASDPAQVLNWLKPVVDAQRAGEGLELAPGQLHKVFTATADALSRTGRTQEALELRRELNQL